MTPRPNVIGVCPECNAGKHQNCNGEAWDDTFDVLVACRCEENDHVRPSEITNMWETPNRATTRQEP